MLNIIHMAGMTIHIALESTIHIAGIRIEPRDEALRSSRTISAPPTNSPTTAQTSSASAKTPCSFVPQRLKRTH